MEAVRKDRSVIWAQYRTVGSKHEGWLKKEFLRLPVGACAWGRGVLRSLREHSCCRSGKGAYHRARKGGGEHGESSTGATGTEVFGGQKDIAVVGSEEGSGKSDH